MASQGPGVSPSQTNEPPMTNGLGTLVSGILEPSSWSETGGFSSGTRNCDDKSDPV